MVNFKADQAEGLRRILSFSRARTVAVVSGIRGAGATSCVINLARALSRQGQRVLVVDENNSSQNVSEGLGLRARFDLKQVIAGYCNLEDALLKGPNGLMVLPASLAAHALPRLDALSEERAVRCFAELDRAADIVLLDVRHGALEPSAFANAAQEVIVVVSAGSSSITGGYSAIKRMSCTQGSRRFHILVNRANDAATAGTVYANMEQVASKHLDVTLDFMGAIPQDPAISAAASRFAAAVDATPFADASRGFAELASAMLRWSAPQDDVSRLDSLDTFMQRAIHGSRLMAAGAGA
jgi:flagellar biosynthesis protein FlhG